MKTKILVVAFCMLMLSVSLIPLDVAEAQPLSRVLGGVNLSGYCRDVVKYEKAELIANNVYAWRCVKTENGFPVWTAISVTGACQWQYGNRYAYALYRRWGDPYSWYCND